MTTDSVPVLLNDGSAPMSSDSLLGLLHELGVEHTTMEHPAVFTVDEAKALRGEIVGAHTKNLFLRNKKGAMWLITCLEDRKVDLKSMAMAVGAKNFSFASHERLMQYLGITPGAVSPLAVANDNSGKVQLVLDTALREIQPLNFHPLDNRRTTSLSTADLILFLNHVDHSPAWLDFDTLTLQSQA